MLVSGRNNVKEILKNKTLSETIKEIKNKNGLG